MSKPFTLKIHIDGGEKLSSKELASIFREMAQRLDADDTPVETLTLTAISGPGGALKILKN